MTTVAERLHKCSIDELEIIEGQLSTFIKIGKKDIEQVLELIGIELTNRGVVKVEDMITRDDYYAIASTELWEHEDGQTENSNCS